MKRLLAIALLLFAMPALGGRCSPNRSNGSSAGQAFSGVLVYDDASSGERPGLLMVPDWKGVTPAAVGDARRRSPAPVRDPRRRCLWQGRASEGRRGGDEAGQAVVRRPQRAARARGAGAAGAARPGGQGAAGRRAGSARSVSASAARRRWNSRAAAPTSPAWSASMAPCRHRCRPSRARSRRACSCSTAPTTRTRRSTIRRLQEGDGRRRRRLAVRRLQRRGALLRAGVRAFAAGLRLRSARGEARVRDDGRLLPRAFRRRQVDVRTRGRPRSAPARAARACTDCRRGRRARASALARNRRRGRRL